MAERGWWQIGVLDPQGPVALGDNTIFLNATIVMLGVIIPVIIVTLAFAWWYRANNSRATRLPDWTYSGSIELVVWSIPVLIILFLGGVAWIGSHDLDPGRALKSGQKTITIEVVSLDWKWLFLYPDQGVASVNHLVIPAGVPIRFQLTSATVMNSFFVPQLGSQIYTMAGMVTTLNLEADHPGTFKGLSAQFSGDGFSDMRFEVEAMQQDGFQHWLDTARQANKPLDAAQFQDLARQAGKVDPAIYSSVDASLFAEIVNSVGQSTRAKPQAPIAQSMQMKGGS